MSERERARRRVVAGLLLGSGLGWAGLLAAPDHAMLLALCRGSGSAWSWPSLRVMLEAMPLAWLAAHWGLMLAAMMLPTLVSPLMHVHQRSFRQRRARAAGLFLVAYLAVWMAVGVLLTALQLLVNLSLPQSAAPPVWPALVAAAVALVWQCSPAKQRCLNRSHTHRALAAFGRAADRDALAFGLEHGLWCAGSCWALMLVPMLMAHGHMAAMLAVTVVMVGERLDAPAPLRWRLRGLGTPTRLVMAQARAAHRSLRNAAALRGASRA